MGVNFNAGLPPTLKAYRGGALNVNRWINDLKGSFNQIVRGMYAKGEQGFFYDPNDLTEEKIKWRKNLLTYTDKFNQPVWGKNGVSVIDSTELNPDISGNSFKVVQSNTVGPHRISQVFTSFKPNTQYTLTVVAKAAEMSLIGLAFTNSIWGDSSQHVFNLLTGQITSFGNPSQATIASLGNGWFVCQITRKTGGGGGGGVHIGLQLTSTVDPLAESYTGDASSGLYISRVQLDEGIATPYQSITDFNTEFLQRFPLHTLYQDVAGTIPVTSVGQPVGLVLDKSKGLALGSNLIPNGSFSSDTAWGKGAGWTIADGVARFDGSAAFSNLGNTTPSSINGKWLRVELDLSNVGALVTQVRILASGALAATIPVSGAGKYSAMVLGGSIPSIGIQSQGQSGANYAFTLDNVSVKEAFGNHAYQTTSASRPILRQNAVTGANYLEFDGSDDFLQTNNIDFTSTDKVSLFAGVRKLSNVVYGQIAELGVDWFNNNGTFALSAPFGANATNAAFVSRGTTAASRVVTNIVAPSSIVLVGIGNISGGACKLGINGTYGTSNTSQGTGNYGNYPLYIGRRGGTSLPFNGHIYSLIGVGRLATESETAAIEKVLAKQLGVTLP